MTPAEPTRRLPSFAEQLRLLWALRLTIGLNRSGRGSRLLAIAGFLASSAPALFLAGSAYQLMHHPVIATSEHWGDFIVRLLCFVTSCGWVVWPVLSAGVDDHSELSRYASLPISGGRLMAASALASLFEPRAFVFFGPLVGAIAGYLHVHGGSFVLAAVGLIAFALLNAAVARIGLHAMLNVLKQPRSVELMGGAFVLTLVACSFIPPIDVSWLWQLQGNVQAVPDTIIADAALALGRFPTGWLGHGVTALSQGRWYLALADLFGIVELTLIAGAVGYGLLLDFHRQSGRGGIVGSSARSANPFATSRSRFAALVTREAVDLWHNPRARLLVSVPFILSILLKLLSARALFAYFLGDSVDLWLMGSLCLYGAVVIASTFSQNTFGYDGHGFVAFVAAPLPLGDVLKAKNLVHAVAGVGLAVAEAVFYAVYFGRGDVLTVTCSVTAALALTPILITAGNFLSLVYPVKFHANLRRRDKLPFAASMLGVAAASLGSAPFVWSARLLGTQAPSAQTLAMLCLSAGLGWWLYRVTLPTALSLLQRRREAVLAAVTRE